MDRVDLSAGVIEDLLGHVHAARDLEPRGGSRDPDQQPVGRPERRFVELHGRVEDVGLLRGPHLERIVVGGCDRRGPGAAEVVHDRDGQRRPLVRIGPGPDLVDEKQRGWSDARGHFGDVAHVRGEGRQVGRDRLLVPDVGQDLAEDRQLRCARRNVQAHLGHQRGKPDGLERDGLPAGVGPADDHGLVRAVHLERDRNHRSTRVPQGRFEQDVARLAEDDAPAPRSHARPRAVEVGGQARLGGREVQLGDCRDGGADLRLPAPQGVAQLEQDAADLHLLRLAQAHQVVILFDDRERFDVGRLAARGEAVHDPRYLLARVRAHRDDEAAASDRHDLLLEGPRLLAGHRQERPLDARAARHDLAADAGKLGARAVVQLSRGQDSPFDRREQSPEVRDREGGPGKGGVTRGNVMGREARPQIDARGDHPLEARDLLRLEDHARDCEAHERRLRIGDPPEPEPSFGVEVRGALGRQIEVALDLGRVGRRGKRQGALLSERRLRAAGHERDERLELQRLEGPFIHETAVDSYGGPARRSTSGRTGSDARSSPST